MLNAREQLELYGLEGAREAAQIEGDTPQARRRLARRIEIAHRVMSEPAAGEDLGFVYSGLAQTCLPHSRPATNQTIWRRQSGRFRLIVQPGVIDATPISDDARQPSAEEQARMFVGVPYGTRARLIMIYLQTAGVRGPEVPLGKNLSAFLRTLGLEVSGGPRGTIPAIKEQCLRISRANFVMQYDDATGGSVHDARIVADMWPGRDDDWSGMVRLSAEFHDLLRRHPVPLDMRGVAELSGTCLGLDLFTLFTYRLPKLSKHTHLTWKALLAQCGANQTPKSLARSVREVLPDVIAVYPDAKVDVTPHGLTLHPSPPLVPRTIINGLRIAPKKARVESKSA
jgi:hypothetical protein